KRRRVRGDRSEQRLLIAHRSKVRKTVAAVGEHHRQIPDHPTRIMPATPLPHPHKRVRELARESHPISNLREQRGTRVRYQTLSVRRDIYGERALSTRHPQGEPPSSGSGPSASPRIPATPDVQAPRPSRGASLNARSGLRPFRDAP